MKVKKLLEKYNGYYHIYKPISKDVDILISDDSKKLTREIRNAKVDYFDAINCVLEIYIKK